MTGRGCRAGSKAARRCLLYVIHLCLSIQNVEGEINSAPRFDKREVSHAHALLFVMNCGITRGGHEGSAVGAAARATPRTLAVGGAGMQVQYPRILVFAIAPRPPSLLLVVVLTTR